MQSQQQIDYKEQYPSIKAQYYIFDIKNSTFIRNITKMASATMKSPQDIDHKAGPNRWIAHTFLILFFQVSFFGSIGICVYAMATLNFKLIGILATISILQKMLGRRSQLVIGLVNKYIQPLNYYKSFKRIYEQQIPEQDPCMFTFHPHSVLSYCIVSNMNSDDGKMSQMRGLASRFLLAMPVIGWQLRLWGVESVNAKNILRLMKKKRTIGLLPGGFEEATLTTPKQIRVYIKHRKGFIKYALQHGYTIFPVLTYNEHKAFWTFDGFLNARLLLNKLKMPGTIFGMGFLWFFLPLNLDIINIVGKGIKRMPENQGKNITNEEINETHQRYIQELERMHEKYRHEYGEAPLVLY